VLQFFNLKPFHFPQISMSVSYRVRVMKTLTASTPTGLTHVLAERDSLEMDLFVQVLVTFILSYSYLTFQF